MVVLDYQIAARSPEKSGKANLLEATQDELHYSLFLGDVSFRIDGADFSAPWGWVPILDFAVAVAGVVCSLKDGDDEAFEFTESEALIRFRRQGDRVAVAAEYVDASALVLHRDLKAAVTEFKTRVISDLMSAYPELAQNSAFLKVRAEQAL